MDYIRAAEILPPELVEELQQYADGAVIYIPKKEEDKKKKTGPEVDKKKRHGGEDRNEERTGEEECGDLYRFSGREILQRAGG